MKKESDFIGIASDLLTFDKKYKDIIENQLGNVIIVKNLDSIDKVGKLVDYKYRVVSLDGEILYAGGGLSGGKQNNNVSNSKFELKKLSEEATSEKNKLVKANHEYEKIEKEYVTSDEKIDLLNKKIILLSESLNNKKMSLEDYTYQLENKYFEIKGLGNVVNNSVQDELIRLIEVLTEKAKEKISFDQLLVDLKDKKSDIQNDISTLENSYKIKNQELSRYSSLLKEKEVKKGKLEVKLENLLFTLSDDYNLTYDAAKDNYFLDINKDEARGIVKQIKRNIDLLGEVNLGSISEFNRLNERYEFLLKQETDLKEASENLLSIINEMDTIMIDKFEKSFNDIAKEFKKVFREIFQGGKGELKLSDPSDMLHTGIEIIAEPPGKKINSTIALSGGEKSLTAICLLFSILNVRPVPFIILDEAEAALDEANVDMFGKYINDKKKSSQFILITHKKRMMEYADDLYGITMQESGVSKIVSTKLEN